jgi:alkyl hydroperoxide reductase subunit AhpC
MNRKNVVINRLRIFFIFTSIFFLNSNLYSQVLKLDTSRIEYFTTKFKMLNQKAPDFEGRTLDGKKFKLSDHKGKVVVLNFASKNCGYCSQEIPDLNRIHKDAQLENFEFISLYLDSDTALSNHFCKNDDGEEYQLIKKFNKVKDVDFKIIPNAHDIIFKYKIEMYPTNLIIDKDGIIRKVILYQTDVFEMDLDLGYNVLKRGIDQYLYMNKGLIFNSLGDLAKDTVKE